MTRETQAMRMILAALCALPVFAWAEEWESLSGQRLTDALTSRTIGSRDGGMSVDFKQDGTVLHSGFAPGRWRVDDTRMCIKVPEKPERCVTVARNGIDLRLTNEVGDTIVLRYIDL